MLRQHAMSAPPFFSILRRHLLTKRVSLFPLDEELTLNDQVPFGEVVDQLTQQQRWSTVVALQNQKVVGILTERDIVEHVDLNFEQLRNKPLATFMTSHPHTVKASSGITQAIYMMARDRIRNIPVVDRDQRYLGILNMNLIIRYLSEQIAEKIIIRPDPRLTNQKVDTFFISTIGDYEPPPCVFVNEEQPVLEVLHEMRNHRVGAVVVRGEANALSGIFSELDYLHRVLPNGINALRKSVRGSMTPKPTTLQEGASISMVLNQMAIGGYRHLPIVDSNERPVGITSAKQLIALLADCIMADLGGE